jgi:hypothetical protein
MPFGVVSPSRCSKIISKVPCPARHSGDLPARSEVLPAQPWDLPASFGDLHGPAETSRPGFGTSRPSLETSRPQLWTSRPKSWRTSRPSFGTSRPSLGPSRPSFRDLPAQLRGPPAQLGSSRPAARTPGPAWIPTGRGLSQASGHCRLLLPKTCPHPRLHQGYQDLETIPDLRQALRSMLMCPRGSVRSTVCLFGRAQCVGLVL